MARMSEVADPYRLERFVTAQDRGGTYQRAAAELRAGEKASHWMWFVFPQVAGLGLSAMSREYAISCAEEARAYLAHPVLGPRLRECARIVAATRGRSAEQIFGPVDAMKLRSSMTLFAAAADQAASAGGEAAAGGADGNVFREVLEKYFGGAPDEATTARLLRPAPARAGRHHRPVNRAAARKLWQRISGPYPAVTAGHTFRSPGPGNRVRDSARGAAAVRSPGQAAVLQAARHVGYPLG
jgi:uncharacterized protein (DUF1810 family)